jgi:hypothetical protein
MVLHCKGSSLALPTNIRLDFKNWRGTNLAYLFEASSDEKKSYMVLTHGPSRDRHFRILSCCTSPWGRTWIWSVPWLPSSTADLALKRTSFTSSTFDLTVLTSLTRTKLANKVFPVWVGGGKGPSIKADGRSKLKTLMGGSVVIGGIGVGLWCFWLVN